MNIFNYYSPTSEQTPQSQEVSQRDYLASEARMAQLQMTASEKNQLQSRESASPSSLSAWLPATTADAFDATW